ncbi:MAG: hypothetical protein NTY51_06845 [Deltaproteobacteria bacterium]|nr:hypothetical protein [Deltaproteobacteria bacterium]
MELQSLNIQASDVGFLPIVSSFVKKMGVVEEINRLCPGETDVSAGSRGQRIDN